MSLEVSTYDSLGAPATVKPMFPRPFGPHFVLIKPLGKGGMGSVFLAMRVGGLAPTLSAIKKVRKCVDLDRQQEIERRFVDEARLVTQLRHRNIVNVTEAGLVGGDAFLAMEPVRGKTLAELWNACAVEQRGMPQHLAAYIAKEIAAGLAYAHGLGPDTVHRDIAPSNIILSYDGDVKILDFGIATWAKKEVNTATGIVWGHRNYSAPEYLRNQPIDGRADLYSLGVILLEWLTGKSGPDPDAVFDNPTELDERLNQLPTHLRFIVERLVAPSPEDRYHTAEDARDALAGAQRNHVDGKDLSKFIRSIYKDKIAEEDKELAVQVQKAVELSSPKQSGPKAFVASRSEKLGAMDARIVEGSEDKDPLLGRVLGDKYQVEAVLGQGAMGRVYRARHLGLRRDVAIKIGHRMERRQRRDHIRRFMQEAEIMSKLLHQNIATVYDCDAMPEGDFYFVMEYLDGLNLDRLVKRDGPQSVERVLELGVQICEGLAVAHHHEIIHRDLKPANVMLIRTPSEGQDLVKILDFGVAKLLRAELVENPAQSQSHLIMGTPAYMAPEQRMGVPDIDARADIFAAGAILFYLLAGQAPDASETDGVKARAKHRSALKISAPDLPGDVEDVVLACLSPDRQLRPDGANTLRSQLLGCLEACNQLGSSIQQMHSFATTAVVDRRPFWRKKPFAIVVGASMALGAVAIWKGMSATPQPSVVVAQLQPAPAAPELPHASSSAPETQAEGQSENPPSIARLVPASAAIPSPPSGDKGKRSSIVPEKIKPAEEAQPPLAQENNEDGEAIQGLLAQSEHALQIGQTGKAIEAAHKAVAAGAGAKGHLALAKIYFSLEKWPDALAAFDEALKSDPHNEMAARGRQRAAEEAASSKR